jgi:hypothetical protein
MIDLIKTVRMFTGATEEKSEDHCPFRTTDGCSVIGIPCRYGLTEVKVPKLCPLDSGVGAVVTMVTLVRRKS